MKEVQRGRRFVVFDDFLDEVTFSVARTMLARARFDKKDSVISPGDDGFAFRSKGVHFGEELGGTSTGGRPKVYEEIARCVHRERRLYGEGGTDWNRIGFTFWRYPVGNRLGWHNDAGGGRRGEFILFLHDRWRPSWGGELMILDEDTTALDHAETEHESATARMERILDTCPVSPTAVVPKPNRLVLVQAGTVHQIHRVDQTAKLERCTLTGFVSRHVSDRDREETREKLAASLGTS